MRIISARGGTLPGMVRRAFSIAAHRVTGRVTEARTYRSSDEFAMATHIAGIFFGVNGVFGVDISVYVIYIEPTQGD